VGIFSSIIEEVFRSCRASALLSRADLKVCSYGLTFPKVGLQAGKLPG